MRRGQGGDHFIARNVTSQFTAGWDWMQPVRDRNTGIWDAVELQYTGPAALQDLHVTTHQTAASVPLQEQALIKVLKSAQAARS